MDGLSQLLETWIALLGKRDRPTDGVEDYCCFLAEALAARNVELVLNRVAWDDDGWVRSLSKLWRSSAAWRGSWVLIQYTAMSWSRRGFPIGLVAIIRILTWRRVRVAVVFHEFDRQSGSNRLVHRLRGACQDAVIRILNLFASKSVFTTHIDRVRWLRQDDKKSAFIPIGANVPERLCLRKLVSQACKVVAVFGVTEAPNMAAEIEHIAAILREAEKSGMSLRLLLLGRGSSDAEKAIAPILRGSGVDVVAKGVLPAGEIADELASADVLLFVRGPITLRRGSALAGVACGLPIVAYRNGTVETPLDHAGVEWAPVGSTSELAKALVRVLTDSSRWAELHQRNLQIQSEYFSWNHIAQRYLIALRK